MLMIGNYIQQQQKKRILKIVQGDSYIYEAFQLLIKWNCASNEIEFNF